MPENQFAGEEMPGKNQVKTNGEILSNKSNSNLTPNNWRGRISILGFASGLALLLFLPSPSHAFDCAKTSTPTEIAICKDAGLKSLDDKMAQAYFELQSKLPKSGRAILKRSQRFWLKFRDSNCDANIACLHDETKAQFSNLISTPLQMVPLFIWQEGDLHHWEIKISGYEFASVQNMGHRLFNRVLGNLIQTIPLDERTEKQEIASWEREMFMNVSRIDEKLISVSMGNYEYAGGAHPNSWRNMINVDLKAGKLLDINNIFSDGAIEKLNENCRNEIISQKYQDFDGDKNDKLKLLEAEYPGVVAQHMGDARNWNFDPQGAQVVFDSYAIGAYVEGPYECEFSTKLLQSLARDKKLFTP